MPGRAYIFLEAGHAEGWGLEGLTRFLKLGMLEGGVWKDYAFPVWRILWMPGVGLQKIKGVGDGWGRGVRRTQGLLGLRNSFLDYYNLA